MQWPATNNPVTLTTNNWPATLTNDGWTYAFWGDAWQPDEVVDPVAELKQRARVEYRALLQERWLEKYVPDDPVVRAPVLHVVARRRRTLRRSARATRNWRRKKWR